MSKPYHQHQLVEFTMEAQTSLLLCKPGPDVGKATPHPKAPNPVRTNLATKNRVTAYYTPVLWRIRCIAKKDRPWDFSR